MEAERGTAVGHDHEQGDGHTRSHGHGHGHEHGHDHEHGKDPAEQEALARDLGEELTDIFARYVRGDVDFADLTFLAYETLQDLYVIASGEYDVEYEDDDEVAAAPTSAGEATSRGAVDDEYDEAEATEQQEDLAQEPAG